VTATERSESALTADDFKLDAGGRLEIEELVERLDDAQFEVRTKLEEHRRNWERAFDKQLEEWRESEEGTAVQERITKIRWWICELEDGGNYSVDDIDD
jgi:hypothetical protein